MKINFDIFMMFVSIIAFTAMWGINILNTFEAITINCIAIVYWGLLYIACRKRDALVSGDEQ